MHNPSDSVIMSLFRRRKQMSLKKPPYQAKAHESKTNIVLTMTKCRAKVRNILCRYVRRPTW